MRICQCSVVVPVYNARLTLHALLDGLGKVLPTVCEQFEVILVNDGSQDGSWDAICELAGEHHWIHGINLTRNYGQHNALLCGIRAAKYHVVVTMDDDLQHPPEEIRKLLAKLGEGYDVVYGTPQEERHGFWRDLASRMTKLTLQSTMGAETARNASAFRAFRTQLRDVFADYQAPFVCIDVLLTWATTRFGAVLVRHAPRQIGRSNYTLRRLWSHALNMMTGFSVLPLQLASAVGFAFTLFGVLVLFFVVGRYLIQGGSVPGFSFLASIIAIFSGVQLFSLGIVGEYLARIYLRAMRRPAYTIGCDTTTDTADMGFKDNGRRFGR